MDKVCTRCKATLPLDHFGPDRRMSLGVSSWCRTCKKADQQARYQADPERARAENRRRAKAARTPERTRARHVLYKYGLTTEAYETLLAEQDGKCAICQTSEPGGKHNTWHVDHCHDSSVVRGLLCGGCNIGLGHFGDNPTRLAAAIDYLARTRQ